jgi:hypothetical protein
MSSSIFCKTVIAASLCEVRALVTSPAYTTCTTSATVRSGPDQWHAYPGGNTSCPLVRKAQSYVRSSAISGDQPIRYGAYGSYGGLEGVPVRAVHGITGRLFER